MRGRLDLSWKGDELYAGRRKVLRIVPDQKYRNMWRVERPDGKLSDVVNHTCAKDAAYSWGLRILNS